MFPYLTYSHYSPRSRSESENRLHQPSPAWCQNVHCLSPLWPTSTQTPPDADLTFDTTCPSALSPSFTNEVTSSSYHGLHQRDLGRPVLHHGVLDGFSNSYNSNHSRSTSYNGATVSRRFAHRRRYAIDSTISRRDPLRQSNDPGLISLGIPDDQSVHDLEAFDFSIGNGVDIPISAIFPGSASHLGPPPHQHGAQFDAPDWGSQAPLTRTGSTKRSRNESDSDDSSTSGDCPFCKNFSGDAKQLSTESISGATSGSMSARCPNVLCGSAPQGIYRDMTGLRIARKHSDATSVQRPFAAVVKTT
ncbi:hypothetical protein CCUS01_01309 [Colletotrichum cuscutae]|uniref:Uncharacterized protein n=1 Tax=Colletotrichum cuscutae TaxID=1209917 RepID=A0AAI9UXA1_9PEZI|nr:hypothetical protein CCUS01_01309 [Colletotrichum cuscutae]